tara:strand:- start:302 stop:544 length:243 start_codon:yes stop_codon:yes gene_type:complete
MPELDKLIEDRDTLENNISLLHHKIAQNYEYISQKEETIRELNKKIDTMCNHEWDTGYFQKYEKPLYTCQKCNIKNDNFL